MVNNYNISDIIKITVLDKYSLKSYGTIFSLIMKEGIVNTSMLKRLLNNDSGHYLSFLVKRKIIERVELTQKQKQYLMDSRDGMNSYNIRKMNAYSFTEQAKQFINSMPDILKSLQMNLKTKLQLLMSKFKDRRRRKENERNNRLELENQLLSMDFEKVLQKSGAKGCLYGLKLFGIRNCLDYYNLKLREIGKLTLITKTTLEKISDNITKELYNNNNFNN